MYEGLPRRHLMQGFTVNHLTFCCRALDDIYLDAQPGSALRGALYHALMRMFKPPERSAGAPLHPVQALMAPEDESARRGRDIPRAFSITPYVLRPEIRRDGVFSFGVSVYGNADALIPYLFQGVPEMGRQGVGRGRGRFRLERIEEVDLLDGAISTFARRGCVNAPRLTMTHARVRETVLAWETDAIRLQFWTPMRLIDRGMLVQRPRMGVIVRRLIERAQALCEQYSPPGVEPAASDTWKAEWARVGAIADALDRDGTREEDIRWLDVHSYSSPKGRTTPISGFIGSATWGCENPELLAWLLWGQSLRVGKNVTKGDGQYFVFH